MAIPLFIPSTAIGGVILIIGLFAYYRYRVKKNKFNQKIDEINKRSEGSLQKTKKDLIEELKLLKEQFKEIKKVESAINSENKNSKNQVEKRQTTHLAQAIENQTQVQSLYEKFELEVEELANQTQDSQVIFLDILDFIKIIRTQINEFYNFLNQSKSTMQNYFSRISLENVNQNISEYAKYFSNLLTTHIKNNLEHLKRKFLLINDLKEDLNVLNQEIQEFSLLNKNFNQEQRKAQSKSKSLVRNIKTFIIFKQTQLKTQIQVSKVKNPQLVQSIRVQLETLENMKDKIEINLNQIGGILQTIAEIENQISQRENQIKSLSNSINSLLKQIESNKKNLHSKVLDFQKQQKDLQVIQNSANLQNISVVFLSDLILPIKAFFTTQSNIFVLDNSSLEIQEQISQNNIVITREIENLLKLFESLNEAISSLKDANEALIENFVIITDNEVLKNRVHSLTNFIKGKSQIETSNLKSLKVISQIDEKIMKNTQNLNQEFTSTKDSLKEYILVSGQAGIEFETQISQIANQLAQLEKQRVENEQKQNVVNLEQSAKQKVADAQNDFKKAA